MTPYSLIVPGDDFNVLGLLDENVVPSVVPEEVTREDPVLRVRDLGTIVGGEPAVKGKPDSVGVIAGREGSLTRRKQLMKHQRSSVNIPTKHGVGEVLTSNEGLATEGSDVALIALKNGNVRSTGLRSPE